MGRNTTKTGPGGQYRRWGAKNTTERWRERLHFTHTGSNINKNILAFCSSTTRGGSRNALRGVSAEAVRTGWDGRRIRRKSPAPRAPFMSPPARTGEPGRTIFRLSIATPISCSCTFSSSRYCFIRRRIRMMECFVLRKSCYRRTGMCRSFCVFGCRVLPHPAPLSVVLSRTASILTNRTPQNPCTLALGSSHT